MGIYVSHHPEHPSHISPYPIPLCCPIASLLSILASCIETALVIYFTYGNMYVSMPFSQIFPPFPSPRVQKSALYICVSFAVLHIGSSAVTNSSCYYYLENETVLKEDQGTVRRMGSLSVFQTTGCNPLVHCCENNSVVHQQKREEEQSN